MDVREIGAVDRVDARHPWESARIAFVNRLIRKFCFRHQGELTIVDIGAGDLFVARVLLKQYPSARIAAVDSAYGDHPDLPDKLLDEDEKKQIVVFSDFHRCKGLERPSIILMMDVLEHIQHPVSMLKDLCSVVKFDSKGVAIITVPAFQRLFSGHDRYLRHYRRYSKQKLESELQQAGLVVIEAGYFFFTLLPFRILGKLRERVIAGKKNGDGTVVGKVRKHPLLDRLLHHVLYLDARIGYLFHKAGINVPGLSCYALCKKYT